MVFSTWFNAFSWMKFFHISFYLCIYLTHIPQKVTRNGLYDAYKDWLNFFKCILVCWLRLIFSATVTLQITALRWRHNERHDVAITSLTIVCSSIYSGADQGKHQSSASLAFVWGIHWWPVNSPHKGPVTRRMFPFDDVIMGDASLFDNFSILTT